MERVPTGTLCTTFNLNLTPTVSRSGMMYVWPVVSPGERIGGGGVVHISDELCRAVSSEGPGDSEGATQAGTLQVWPPGESASATSASAAGWYTQAGTLAVAAQAVRNRHWHGESGTGS